MRDSDGSLRTASSLAASSRYRILARIAAGGMGAVYLGWQHGDGGFRRVVAIKRAYPHLLEDPTFRRLLVSEARISSLVRHPNVVGVSDVVEGDGEMLLVMDYIEGASLFELVKHASGVPLPIAARILIDAAEGLQAVHGCHDENGAWLGLVHRDVSPQNILVGIDGGARIADFGIAQAHSASAMTISGLLRGKPGYMAPDYIETGLSTAQSDVFALGVVAWETFTRRRLFKGNTEVDTLSRARAAKVPAPSCFVADLPREADMVVLKALAKDPEVRYPSARAFAEAMMGAFGARAATRSAVGDFVRSIAGERLSERRVILQQQATVTVTQSARHVSAPEIPVVVGDDTESSGKLPSQVAIQRGAHSALYVAAGLLGFLLVTGGTSLLVANGSGSRASGGSFEREPRDVEVIEASAMVSPPARRPDSGVAETSPSTPSAARPFVPVVVRPHKDGARNGNVKPTILDAPPATAPDNPYGP